MTFWPCRNGGTNVDFGLFGPGASAGFIVAKVFEFSDEDDDDEEVVVIDALYSEIHTISDRPIILDSRIKCPDWFLSDFFSASFKFMSRIFDICPIVLFTFTATDN